MTICITLILHYITLYCVTLRYITLDYVTLRYITLDYVTSHYIWLHYLTLHYITFIYFWRSNFEMLISHFGQIAHAIPFQGRTYMKKNGYRFLHRCCGVRTVYARRSYVRSFVCSFVRASVSPCFRASVSPCVRAFGSPCIRESVRL